MSRINIVLGTSIIMVLIGYLIVQFNPVLNFTYIYKRIVASPQLIAELKRKLSGKSPGYFC